LHPGPNQVNFELSLPAEGNERFLFIGNGGFGGGFGFPEVYPDFEDLTLLTKAGFAIAFTDTGHEGNFLDGSWGTWMTGLFPPDAPGTPEPWSDPVLAPWQFIFQDQVLKFFVFDPGYNSLSFDINSNDLAKVHMIWNRGGGEGTNPDLSAFADRSGKLIIYHGWSDPAVSSPETVRYYQAVIQQQGGLDPTGQFARLFMAPGMQHCIGTGPGPNIFDPLT